MKNDKVVTQAILVSGDRIPGQESMLLNLFNEDGSPFVGGGGVQVYSAQSLPEVDLELADHLELTLPVVAGDAVEFLTRIESRANGDPGGLQPLWSYSENDPVDSLFEDEPLDTGQYLSPMEGAWQLEVNSIQSGLTSTTLWLVKQSGTLLVTFSLSIEDCPVPVDVRNRRILCRRYLFGGS